MTQIEDGRLYPHAPCLRPAKWLINMASRRGDDRPARPQRDANRKLTYSAAGKGTFVHPDIIDARKNTKALTALKDPAIAVRIAEYLWQHYEKFAAHEMADSCKDRNEALCELLALAQHNQELLITFWRLKPDLDMPEPHSYGPDFHTMPGNG